MEGVLKANASDASDDDQSTWHSSTIMKRVTALLVQTKSETTYSLGGLFLADECVNVPEKVVAAFQKGNDGNGGFPRNWESLVAKHLKSSLKSSIKSDALGGKMDRSGIAGQAGAKRKASKNGERAGKRKRAAPPATTLPGFQDNSRNAQAKLGQMPSKEDGRHKSSTKASGKTKQRPRKPVKVAKLFDPDQAQEEHQALPKSRSGRTLVPPLAYWKGQRLLEDRDTNTVTVEAGTVDTTPVSANRYNWLRSETEEDFLFAPSPTEKAAKKAANRRRSEANKTPSALSRRAGKKKSSANSSRLDLTTDINEDLLSPPARSPPAASDPIFDSPQVETPAAAVDLTALEAAHTEPPAQPPSVKSNDKSAGWALRKRALAVDTEPNVTSSAQRTLRNRPAKPAAGLTRMAKQTRNHPKKKVVAKAATDEDDVDEGAEEADDDSTWTDKDGERLQSAVENATRSRRGEIGAGLWNKVAKQLGRSAEECCSEYMKRQEERFVSAKGARGKKARQVDTDDGDEEGDEAHEAHVAHEEKPKLRARPGTLKARREIRNLLQHENKGHEDDLFDSTPFKEKKARVIRSVKQRAIPELKRGSRKAAVEESPDTGPGTPGLLRDVDHAGMDAYIGRTLKNKGRLNGKAGPKARPLRASVHGTAEQLSKQLKSTRAVSSSPGTDNEDYYFSE